MRDQNAALYQDKNILENIITIGLMEQENFQQTRLLVVLSAHKTHPQLTCTPEPVVLDIL